MMKNRKNPYELVRFKAEEMVEGWEHTELYDILTEYFLNSDRFEKRNTKWNLNKGIHCIGPVGTGKTKAFEILRELMRGSDRFFDVVECRHIVREYKNRQDAVLDQYGRNLRRIVCFDEMGFEEQGIRFFGNTTNVMAEIMTDRYKLFTDHGIKTITISNLSMPNFETMYGERLRDRLREMSNVIIVKGDSFRAKREDNNLNKSDK